MAPPIDFCRGKSRQGNWYEVMTILFSLVFRNESSPLSSLRRWTINVLEFQGSVSLLNSSFKYNVILTLRKLHLSKSEELCTTPQFAVLLVSLSAGMKIVRSQKSITKKTVTLRLSCVAQR